MFNKIMQYLKKIFPNNTTSGNTIDMTQGSPLRLLLRFSIPLLAGNALQQFYYIINNIVIGRFVGETALAGIGVAFSITYLLSTLFTGFSSGAVILISKYYGGNAHENLYKTIEVIYSLLFIIAIPLSILGIIFTNPLLDLMAVPVDARQDTYLYLVITIGGLVGNLGYQANAGILQGIGNTKAPLVLLGVSCVCNVALDLVFVLVFSWGMAGVAMATVISQLLSWKLGIIYIKYKYPAYNIRMFSLQFPTSIFKYVIQLGLPTVVQQVSTALCILLIQRLVNQYGASFAAGFSVANNLDSFIFLPIQSLSAAVTIFTGQNIGIQNLKRVNSGIRSALFLSALFSMAGLLIIPAGSFLMQLFTNSPEVIASGVAFLNRLIPFYILLAASSILSSTLQGAGNIIVPVISSIFSLWFACVPGAYILSYFFGGNNLFFCYVISWAFSLLILAPYFYAGAWQKKAIKRVKCVLVDSNNLMA